MPEKRQRQINLRDKLIFGLVKRRVRTYLPEAWLSFSLLKRHETILQDNQKYKTLLVQMKS